ncbi:hypothetical protein OEIGOIKO_03399 [Streptomyces chrestomyceticus JCM 4735]|uniref:Secreted protein n=1 Tax=Streptomyces chrestomyceticus JCM 4735 TaxID=1306181 RepID=A0A7U9KVR2_9ACTN|nr:phage tail protein [Streptomyces chrestomyceticus]GCD35653.1 hypothetical protein OEIGOIKO_03399 [Streptomyces chrestomyceticus JCM 4735]
MNVLRGGRWAMRGAAVASAALLTLTGATLATEAAAASTAVAEDNPCNPNYCPGASTFIMKFDGVSVEFISSVNGWDTNTHTLVLQRGSYHNPVVDRWIDDAIAGREGRLKSMSVVVYDDKGWVMKRYNFGGAWVERIDSNGSGQALHIRYFTLEITD